MQDGLDKEDDGEWCHIYINSIEEAIEIYGAENIETWDITPDGIVPILTDEFLGK